MNYLMSSDVIRDLASVHEPTLNISYSFFSISQAQGYHLVTTHVSFRAVKTWILATAHLLLRTQRHIALMRLLLEGVDGRE